MSSGDRDREIQFLVTAERGLLPDVSVVHSWTKHYSWLTVWTRRFDRVDSTEDGHLLTWRGPWWKNLSLYHFQLIDDLLLRLHSDIQSVYKETNAHVRVDVVLPDVYGCQVTVNDEHVTIDVGHDVITRMTREKQWRKRFLDTIRCDVSDAVCVCLVSTGHIVVTSTAKSGGWWWKIVILQTLVTLLRPFQGLLPTTPLPLTDRCLARCSRRPGHDLSSADSDDCCHADAHIKAGNELSGAIFRKDAFLKRMTTTYPELQFAYHANQAILNITGRYGAVKKAAQDTFNYIENLSESSIPLTDAQAMMMEKTEAQNWFQQTLDSEGVCCSWNLDSFSNRQRKQKTSALKVLRVAALRSDGNSIRNTFNKCLKSSFPTSSIKLDEDQISCLQSDSWKQFCDDLQRSDAGRISPVLKVEQNTIAICDAASSMDLTRAVVCDMLDRCVMDSRLERHNLMRTKTIRDLQPGQLKLLTAAQDRNQLPACLQQTMTVNSEMNVVHIHAPIHTMQDHVNVLRSYLMGLSAQETRLAAHTAQHGDPLLQPGDRDVTAVHRQQHGQGHPHQGTEQQTDSLHTDNTQTNTDVRQGVKELQTEVTQEVKEVQTEVTQEVKAVQTEVRQEEKEVQAVIRQEVNEVQAVIRQEVKEVLTEVRQEVNEVQAVIRQEVKEVQEVIRQEVKEVQAVIRQEVKEVQAVIRQEVKEVQAVIRQEHADVQTDNGNIRTEEKRIQTCPSADHKRVQTTENTAAQMAETQTTENTAAQMAETQTPENTAAQMAETQTPENTAAQMAETQTPENTAAQMAQAQTQGRQLERRQQQTEESGVTPEARPGRGLATGSSQPREDRGVDNTPTPPLPAAELAESRPPDTADTQRTGRHRQREAEGGDTADPPSQQGRPKGRPQTSSPRTVHDTSHDLTARGLHLHSPQCAVACTEAATGQPQADKASGVGCSITLQKSLVSSQDYRSGGHTAGSGPSPAPRHPGVKASQRSEGQLRPGPSPPSAPPHPPPRRLQCSAHCWPRDEEDWQGAHGNMSESGQLPPSSFCRPALQHRPGGVGINSFEDSQDGLIIDLVTKDDDNDFADVNTMATNESDESDDSDFYPTSQNCNSPEGHSICHSSSGGEGSDSDTASAPNSVLYASSSPALSDDEEETTAKRPAETGSTASCPASSAGPQGPQSAQDPVLQQPGCPRTPPSPGPPTPRLLEDPPQASGASGAHAPGHVRSVHTDAHHDRRSAELIGRIQNEDTRHLAELMMHLAQRGDQHHDEGMQVLGDAGQWRNGSLSDLVTVCNPSDTDSVSSDEASSLSFEQQRHQQQQNQQQQQCQEPQQQQQPLQQYERQDQRQHQNQSHQQWQQQPMQHQPVQQQQQPMQQQQQPMQQQPMQQQQQPMQQQPVQQQQQLMQQQQQPMQQQQMQQQPEQQQPMQHLQQQQHPLLVPLLQYALQQQQQVHQQ